MTWITRSDLGVIVSVRVTPRAAKDGVQGICGEALKVRVTAPPVDGRANKAVVRLLSRCLGVAPSRVSILGGETGRRKRVLIRGVTPEEVAGSIGE